MAGVRVDDCGLVHPDPGGGRFLQGEAARAIGAAQSGAGAECADCSGGGGGGEGGVGVWFCVRGKGGAWSAFGFLRGRGGGEGRLARRGD